MTKYAYNGADRLKFALMTLVYGSVVLFLCFFPAKRPWPIAERLMLTAPFILITGLVACFALYSLLDTFTVFLLDAGGIHKRRLSGRIQELAWRDLARAEPAKDGSGALVDHHGRRMTIPPAESGYRSEDGRSLHADLVDCLAQLPPEAERRVENQREFRVGDASDAIGAAIFALVLICLGGALLIVPAEPPTPLAGKVGIIAFFLGFALLIVWSGLKQATRVLIVTESSLIDRSRFGSREIPFAKVVAVTTQDVATRSKTMEVTTIRSAETTIKLSSRMANYDRLVQQVHSLVGDRIAENAPQAMADETRRQLRMSLITLFVFGSLCGLGLHWVGSSMQEEGQIALRQQQAIDASGKRTTGEVTDVEKKGSKAYILTYRFPVNGKTYSHRSRVSRDDYENPSVGDAIQLDYLPNDPEVSRANLTIARERAGEQLRLGHGMMLFGWGIPFLLSGLALTHKPRYRSTAAHTGRIERR